MEENAEQAFFKVLIVGDGAVGKTSLCTNMTTNQFFADYQLTVGSEFFIVKQYVKNISVTMQIFDLGGQQQFSRIRSILSGGAKGVFLAFDITRRDSFYSLEDWLNTIQVGLHPKAPKILMATKFDLIEQREVWKEDIEDFKMILGIDAYVETSAYTSDGVKDAFELMAQLLIARFEPSEYTKQAQKIKFLESFSRSV
jgi:small GTP-binding protein